MASHRRGGCRGILGDIGGLWPSGPFTAAADHKGVRNKTKGSRGCEEQQLDQTMITGA